MNAPLPQEGRDSPTLNEAADDVIVRYLLGELPPDEQSELERRYFADPELLDRVDAAEDDLIDDYVRGELTDEQRRHFETRFLDARRIERVRTAEALLRAVPPRTVAPRRAWALPLGAALFAAALLTVVSLALENRARRARNATLVAQRKRAAAAAATTTTTTTKVRRSAELERALRRQEGPAPADAVDTLPMQFASIVLAPAPDGDGAERPALLIAPSASAVRLEAPLEVEAARYDATLQRAGGEVIWKGTALTAQRAGGEPRLVLTLPRERFRGGAHRLTITAPGLVADYGFDVILR